MGERGSILYMKGRVLHGGATCVACMGGGPRLICSQQTEPGWLTAMKFKILKKTLFLADAPTG
jgi:hypothetical protein